MAEYGVSSFDAYVQLMQIKRAAAIENNMTLGQQPNNSDLSFFIQQTANLNWRNIDYFINMPRPLALNIQTTINTRSSRCFIVFKNQQVIIQIPAQGANLFSLKAAPKDTDAHLLVIGYRDGQPELAMAEINTNDMNYQLAPMPVTVAEMKEALQTLDEKRNTVISSQ
jgi:hypothetical protein